MKRSDVLLAGFLNHQQYDTYPEGGHGPLCFFSFLDIHSYLSSERTTFRSHHPWSIAKQPSWRTRCRSSQRRDFAKIGQVSKTYRNPKLMCFSSSSMCITSSNLNKYSTIYEPACFFGGISLCFLLLGWLPLPA